MSHRCLLLVVSALALLLAVVGGVGREPPAVALPPFDPDRPMTDAERTERVKQVRANGSSPEQVRQLLGPPDRSARQILYHRTREQWVYDAFAVRLEFEYLRGQEARLLSVQPVGTAKP